ncbi:MAG: RimK family alpha-L-glutamate ligase [Desulfurococcaceae archaeon]
MMIGVLTRNQHGWASTRLIEAIKALGHTPLPFKFNDIAAFINEEGVKLFAKGVDLIKEVPAVIVRPLGRSSLDQAIFRLDLLYAMHESGVEVINRPSAIEKCTDKFRSLYILKMHGVPVPRTIATERSSLALKGLDLLKSSDVVVKPVFGSRGHGSTRVRDRDVLWEVLRSMSFARHVLYLQEFLPHKGIDIRAFILGDRVLAAMHRIAPANAWKTNVAQGAMPKRIDKLDPVIEELALKAAKVLECEVAGVDIVVVKGSPYVLEVNSQPGWSGLQSVVEKDIAMEIVKYVVDKLKK